MWRNYSLSSWGNYKRECSSIKTSLNFPFSSVIHLSDGVDDVVDLEYGPDALAGQGDGGGGHQQRLDHVLLQDVGDGALADVDAGALVALGVPGEANSVLANIHTKKREKKSPVPELGDGGDGVEPRVLRQGVGDDLEGLREGLEAVRVGANQAVGVAHQLQVQLGL